MEEHPIGIAMIPSASDKEKDKMFLKERTTL